MSKYNKKQEKTVITNMQGGESYQLDDKLAFISLLSTGLNKSYFEEEDDRETRLIELMDRIAVNDKFFLAQAIIYARTKMGQRTVTHRASVHLASLLDGEEWGKAFFSKRNRKNDTGGIIYRLDDMTEISACYFHFNENKNLSNPMKKGFKQALENSTKYEIAKYQSKNKDVSLIDMVNLLHPKATNLNKEAFELLVNGNLNQFDTIEDKNTTSGLEISSKIKTGELTKEEGDEKLKSLKSDNFKELIETKKIGYLALLRNLRNIIKTDEKLVKSAGELLTDRAFIKKSLVFPHQIDLALEVILEEINTTCGKKMLKYINEAYELSIDNMKDMGLYGRTAVVVDTSGSMTSNWNPLIVNGKQASGLNRTPIEKASLIAASFSKGLNADLYQFATDTKEINYNPLDSINTIKKTILDNVGLVGHGTNASEIFTTLNGKYDRIFIISDFQTSDHVRYRGSTLHAYKKLNSCDPFIYTIDLCGCGTTSFKNTSKTIELYGYGKDIFECPKKYEIDPKTLLNDINNIKL